MRHTWAHVVDAARAELGAHALRSRKPKVGDSETETAVKAKDVLGLQVSASTRQRNSGHAGHEDGGAPVDDVEPVEVLKRTKQLGRVEPTPALVELALTLQVVEELSSVDCNHQSVSKFS